MQEKLTGIIDYFRNKLSEEQLRLADAITTNQELNNQLQEKNLRIAELESELQEYRVSMETEDQPDAKPVESGR